MPGYHGAATGFRAHALVGCLAVCVTMTWGASGTDETAVSARAQAPGCEVAVSSGCEPNDRPRPTVPEASRPGPPRPCALLDSADVAAVPGLAGAQTRWERHESRLPRPVVRQSCVWHGHAPDGPSLEVALETGEGRSGSPAGASPSVQPETAGGDASRCYVLMRPSSQRQAAVEMSLSTSRTQHQTCVWAEELAAIVADRLS